MMEVIVGLGIVAFIICFIAFKLDNEHAALKVLMVFFAIFFLFLVPKYVNDFNDDCELKVSNESFYNNYVYGSNFTDYHWEDYDGASTPPDYNSSANTDAVFLFHINQTVHYEYETVCIEDDSNTTLVFFKFYNWFMRIVLLYLGLYFVWVAFKSLKDLADKSRSGRYGKKG